MSNPGIIYIKNVGIEGVGGVVEGLHYYNGTIQTNSLNKRHFFEASAETLRSIQQQANEGVNVYPSHRTYSAPIGKSTAATMYGGKVNSTFFIKEGMKDVNSDDHIARLDAGIVDMLSTGLLLTDESEMVCNVCLNDGLSRKESRMQHKPSWFISYFECEAGHVLGSKLRNGDRVTAKLHGPVDLQEYSIVPSGADPGAKMIKKLKESMESNSLDETFLLYVAESNNFAFNSLMNSLGIEAQDPDILQFNLGGLPEMNNPKLLQKENERLQSELDAATTELGEVTTERDALKEKVESLEGNEPKHSDEDFVTLQEERDELKNKLDNAPSEEDLTAAQEENTDLRTQLTKAESDLVSAQEKASVADTLRSTLEENYRALYTSLYYDGIDSDMAETEAKTQMNGLNVLEMYNSVTSMRRSLAKKRAKGRQSTGDAPSRSKARIPAHINEIM